MRQKNTNCCVHLCHSRRGKNTELSFHKFPLKDKSFVYGINELGQKEKIDKLEAWTRVLALRRPPSKHSRVCSLHFKKEDFVGAGVPRQRPRLQASAVPSQKLPNPLSQALGVARKPLRQIDTNTAKCQISQYTKPATTLSLCEEEAVQGLLQLHQSNTEQDMALSRCSGELVPAFARTHAGTDEQQVPHCSGEVATACAYPMRAQDEQPIQESTGDVAVMASTSTHKEASASADEATAFASTSTDKTEQHIHKDCGTSFANIITSDKHLNTMTGIPRFVLLNTTVVHCEEVFGPVSTKNKLCMKERVVLTFMKLKNAFSYAVLAVFFKTVTAATCRNIVHETLIMLAKVLSPAIHWPSIEEIQRNIPECFQSLQKARIVIDCTEIPVQRVKSLRSIIRTYSDYKKGHTIKYMTAETPAGLIAFISKGFGGRVSDKAIFEQSGLVQKLESFHDAIMVDKGFLIRNITDTYGIQMIQPPFLKKQKQFSRGHARLNQQIAKARVHVERVNQRIKIFEIIKKPLPASLWPRSDDIFTITCAIVNLSNPILDDCRFLGSKRVSPHCL